MSLSGIKTFVIGGHGFIGSHLLAEYSKYGSETFGTQYKSLSEPNYLNLENPDLSNLPIEGYGYTHAVIAAASGNPIECEKDSEKTFACDVENTLALAGELAALKITPILFSTAYVFDGKTGGYTEKAQPSPINIYGRQRAELEKRLDKYCKGNYLILRLNKVFTLESGDGTLFDEIASKLIKNESVRAAYNQVFSPIFIDDVINITLYLQRIGARGLYNVCGNDVTSRLELTLNMAQLLAKDANLVQTISLDDLSDEIIRPKLTDLCCHKLFATGVKPLKSIQYYMQKIAYERMKHATSLF